MVKLAVLVALALATTIANGAPTLAPRAAAISATLPDGSVLNGGTQGSQVYWYGELLD